MFFFFFQEFASCLRKSVRYPKCIFPNEPPSFLDSVSYHLRDAQKNRSEPGAHFRFFLGWALGPFEDQGRPISGRHVLSVSVSVQSAMECQMTCQMTCVCTVFLDRHDAVCHLCATRKKRLGDLLDADALECHLLDGQKFLHGADHSRCEKAHTHLGFEPNVAVLHGMRRESVLCVDVKCANICCFITYFYSGEGDFSSKSAKKQTRHFSILGSPSPYDSQEKLHFLYIRMPKTHGNQGSKHACTTVFLM